MLSSSRSLPHQSSFVSSNYGTTNYHPYTKSHCACDKLFYKCLKTISSDTEDLDAANIASSIGRMYFNVFRLECGEPHYRKVCVESKLKVPHRNLKAVANGDKESGILRKRLFFGRTKIEEPEDVVCLNWALDTSKKPRLEFRKTKTFF